MTEERSRALWAALLLGAVLTMMALSGCFFRGSVSRPDAGSDCGGGFAGLAIWFYWAGGVAIFFAIVVAVILKRAGTALHVAAVGGLCLVAGAILAWVAQHPWLATGVLAGLGLVGGWIYLRSHKKAARWVERHILKRDIDGDGKVG